MDLDDFQIKKVDEDKSEMPKFNIQLNHVQRNSENQNQQEEINPFQVNLKDRAIYTGLSMEFDKIHLKDAIVTWSDMHSFSEFDKFEPMSNY